jgi:hypothetical protein
MWHDVIWGLEKDIRKMKLDGARLCMCANDGDLSYSLHRLAWISNFVAQTKDQ